MQRVLDQQVHPLVAAAIGPLSSAASGASGQVSGSARETIEFTRDAVRDTLPPLEAIKDIGRIEHGIEPLNLSRCSVRALVGEVEEEIRANAALRRVRFYVTPRVDPTEATIDRERVERALREMVTAATFVTRSGGVIRLKALW